ncbi:MAG TPA: pyruvate, water dikinase regulatory protein, partial [Anaerolineae bacterium]|nr:pyruvate, water dikinase regulatory protein [Anaerolineae bacterium]
MNPQRKRRTTTPPPPIYIVSGGVGASGEQLVQTVLAQFPDSHVPVITVGNVRQVTQIKRVVAQAKQAGGTLAHTLVDDRLRRTLIDLAHEEEVVAIDLMGPLLSRLESVLQRNALAQPGLYRQFHRAYFERVSAIEFTMAHDDGQHRAGWPQADIVLVGVSRAGKTPLSMYLAVLGWKVANVPLVPEVPPPPELFKVDRHHVIALTIRPDQLLVFREQRYARLGVSAPIDYVAPRRIAEEVQAALKVFRRGHFAVIDVTDKP